MLLPQFYIDDLIKKAIEEDINYIDQASAFVIPEDDVTTARFVAKADGVLCGIDVALRVFTLLDPGVAFEILKRDGDDVRTGDLIARITGKTLYLLQGERTALNLLQHMSGVATQTR